MFTKRDIRLFNKAKIVANLSDYSQVHIGCIAVYHDSIVGMGCNTNKTHPMQKKYNVYRPHGINYTPKLHAEINCINQIKFLNINFSKVKLYIFRTRIDQEFGMCRPCPSCMAAIKDLGIRDVYYTTDNGYSYEKIVTRRSN